MKLKIIETNTLANVQEKRTEIIEIADFLLAGDKIPASLATVAGQLPVSTAANTWAALGAPTADGQSIIANLALANKMAWGASAGGGSAALTNKSGGTVYAGSVVVQSTGNDSAFTTTVLERDLILGVAGEDINNNATGAIKLSGLVTVLVTGNVSRGDYLISSTTAARAKAASISFRAFAVAVTAYGGGGNGSVSAILISPQLLIPNGTMWAYNNDASAITVGDPVAIDPSYTSGFGIKMPTSTGDLRLVGVALTPIASGASGIISIGPNVQPINVTGTVVFGHSLVSSASAHYAQDSGGGGWGPGVIGWALAAQASGTGTINAFIMPYPYYYSLATSIIRTQTSNALNSSTTLASAISDGTNRLQLCWAVANASISSMVFSGAGWTAFQNASGMNPYFGYLVAPALATANITNAWGGGLMGCAVVPFLNGVHQSTPVGTYATANGTGTAVSLVVSCAPGDMVFAGFDVLNTSFTVNARGAGQTNLADIISSQPIHMVVDYAIANGTSFTFTWTTSVSVSWYVAGVAVKSA